MISLQAALAAMVLSGVGQTVLYDFSAEWCGPCRAMAPTVQALAEKGYPVRQVNVDQHPELAAQYKVRGIPCFVMVVDGKEVDRVVGSTSFGRLEQMCKLASTARPTQHQSPHHALPPAVQATTPQMPTPEAAIPETAIAETAPRAGQAVPIPAVAHGSPFSAAVQQTAATSPATPTPTRTPAVPLARHAKAPTPGWTLRGGADAKSDAAMIAASVRLRIEDPNGQSCGSGTIIDARRREALILTCGHIFRDSKGKGPIHVDLFGPRAAETVPGRLISYDLDRDVGLVSIRATGPVTAARVAPPGYRIAQADPVVSVGCNNGDRPSARHSRVTSLDKFLGPPNLEVAGLPVEGRSGGGLFSQDGLVIGVCNAADPTDQDGLYAALGSIQAELQEAKLAFVFDSTVEAPGPLAAGPAPRALVDVNPPPMPKRMPPAADRLATRDASAGGAALSDGLRPPGTVSRPTAGRAAPTLSPAEQAALDEVRRRLKDGAEIIFVVRSRTNPNSQSEIFTLDRASPAFLERLVAESRPDGPLMSTSLEVPPSTRPRTPATPHNTQPPTPND